MQIDRNKKFVYDIGLGYSKSKKITGYNKQNIENPDEVARLLEINKHLQNDIVEKDLKIQQSEKRIQQLQGKYEQIIERMKNQFFSLESTMAKIERVINQKDVTIQKLRSQKQISNEKFNTQKQTLLTAIKSKEQCINELALEVEKITKVFNQKFEDENQKSKKQILFLKASVQSLKNQIQQISNKNSTLVDENEELALKVAEKARKIVQLQIQQKQTHEMRNEQKDEKQLKIGNLKQQRFQLEQNVNILRQQLYSSENEMRLLKQEFEAYKILKEIEMMERTCGSGKKQQTLQSIRQEEGQ